ncbi:MAG: SulP family inorganic anion transporter [Verrucomicrobiales bacterium]|nr:SulP family inorganic anion transporter [Verrucomicrobiales bacterium]
MILEDPLDPFPIRKAFTNYKRKDFAKDSVSGLNVALLAFPQGMAYAVIAELPIQFGIISGAVAAIVAPLFAGSRHTVLGPTNATAFMIFSSFAAFSMADKTAFLPLFVLIVGLLLVIGAFLRVAELIQFISRSVVVGYITGAAILIIANQIRHVLGVELNLSEGPKTFFTIIQNTFSQIKETEWEPLALSFATLAMWIGLSWKWKRLPVFAVTLVTMTGVYALLHSNIGWTVATFDSFQPSDLKPKLPTISENGLFYDIGHLLGVAFSVAFLATLENSVMSKTLASQRGEWPNMNQDMLSVGLANIVTSFAGGMPASGSLTRSALNFSSGARSRLSSIISGILCLLGALLIGKYMHLVPKCSLAVLVICIAFSLINRRRIQISLYSTPGDAAVLITTFLAALLMPLSVAIFVGVGLSIVLYLRASSRPYLTEYEITEHGELKELERQEDEPTPAVSVVHVEGELFFGAAEIFRAQIQKIAYDPAIKIIILQLKNARRLDATSVIALEELVNFLRSKNRDVVLSGVTKDVFRVLKNSGTLDTIGRKNTFPYNSKNPNLATKHSLKRALELLGTENADIRIFYDPNKS